MPRALTQGQFANVSATSTRPIYLVQLQFDSVIEYLSSSGPVTFDGIAYEAGGINVDRIAGENSASLSLFATEARVAQVIGGSWRGERVCNIYGIPATPSGDAVYTLEEGVLLLPGYIDSARVSGDRVAIAAVHRYASGSYTPRLNCSELSVYIPPAGTAMSWEGVTYTLVSKR